MSACNCCSEPPCDGDFLIQADQVSGYKDRCGVMEFIESTPPKKYLKSNWSSTSSGPSCNDTTSTLGSATYDRDTCVCTGSDSRNGGGGRNSHDGCGSFFFGAGCLQCSGTGTVYSNTATATTKSYTGSYTSDSVSCSASGSSTLSDEYTDEMLTEDAEASMPDFDDDWNDGAWSFRFLTQDNLTLRKAKWRIRHLPTGSCYLKVWYRTRFREGPSDPWSNHGADQSYVWNGEGNPCLIDPSKGYSHADNYIFSEPEVIPYPEENGENHIEIRKWSCVKGYEPEISDPSNPQPNGYPDPTWEAAAP